jgi:hypothetical protein
MVAAPIGRDQLYQAVIKAGITSNVTLVLDLYLVIIFVVEVAAAGLHGMAYYGLKRLRPWGWVAAVIVSAAWSLVLIGIPVLVFLLRRQTRHAYGIG